MLIVQWRATRRTHCPIKLATHCIKHRITVNDTSGSAVAEGPRDALVSRNSATYKTSHLKTIVWHNLQTDGQTLSLIHI